MRYIRIVADHNDADYVETFRPVSDEEMEKLLPVAQAIKEYGTSDNWPRGCYCYRPDRFDPSVEEIYPFLTQEQIDYFDEWVPKSEGNVHTIESITVMEISEQEELL